MRVLIAGAGIGGLTAALALHARGIDVQVCEAVEALQPLGVGINILPHALAALDELGAADEIAALGVKTRMLLYANRHGQTLWSEPRGLAAGYPVPQVSIHRGRLQRALLARVQQRPGADAVRCGLRVEGFESDAARGVRSIARARRRGLGKTGTGAATSRTSFRPSSRGASRSSTSRR